SSLSDLIICDLSSFPTRRSSDLRNLVSGSRYTRISLPIVAELRLRTDSTPYRQIIWSTQRRDSSKRWQRRKLHRSCCLHHHLARSEEHTSELQSPDHLVCRPLRA